MDQNTNTNNDDFNFHPGDDKTLTDLDHDDQNIAADVFDNQSKGQHQNSYMNSFNDNVQEDLKKISIIKKILFLISIVFVLVAIAIYAKSYYEKEQLKKQEIENLQIEKEAKQKIDEQRAKEKENELAQLEKNKLEIEQAARQKELAQEAEKKAMLETAKKIKNKTKQDWFPVNPN